MSKKQKLELTWVGKDSSPVIEPRILIKDATLSHGDPDSENMLIHGDNLLALKALESSHSGKVKCVYIDPPYNTGTAFEHYEDGLEHSLWLSLMSDRLKILHKLLSDDGSIWVSIDENEVHYLKVLMDEIFGRRNFVIQTVIQRGAATGHKAINPTPVQVCDLMLVYAKDKNLWKYKPAYKERGYDKAYSQFIKHYDLGPEHWEFISLKEALRENNITLESALVKFPERIIRYAQPTYASVGQQTRDLIDLSKSNPNKVYIQQREGYPDIYLIKGNRILFYIDKLKEVNGTLTTAELVTNLWTDMNYQGIAKEGSVSFSKGKKPELQINRILEMATDPGDLVLDSFLGSGTTAAVAHKMQRKWIGIELGEHAYTHCIPRINRVIDNEDPNGITKATGWQGGGGFSFFELASSLLIQDEHGNWVISKDYDANMLAHAMAKQEGFTYDPSQSTYWKQGFSTENDYIFTTTQHITVELLDTIHAAMQGGESLLVACRAFDGACKDRYDNITIKKIPHILLGRCEFGKNDYSLNVTEVTEPDFVEGEDE
jgi:adenine-specific DNA-methyltransferase